MSDFRLIRQPIHVCYVIEVVCDSDDHRGLLVAYSRDDSGRWHLDSRNRRRRLDRLAAARRAAGKPSMVDLALLDNTPPRCNLCGQWMPTYWRDEAVMAPILDDLAARGVTVTAVVGIIR